MAKNKNGWDRSLGTSKKEQGIITPPPPRYKKFKNGKLKCHCLFRGKELWQECYAHIYWRKQQEALMELIKQMDKERKETEDGRNTGDSKTVQSSQSEQA